MDDTRAARRTALRLICGCAGAGLFWRGTGAQEVLDAKGRIPSTQEAAGRHAAEAQRAADMSAAVTRSLDGLTEQTNKALERAEQLQAKAGELASEISGLRQRKDALLEEYRQGLFCSGCGQTRSQILAKGEKFPHSGQSIVRPTAEQIAAKERELQSPIDAAQRRLDDARKELDDNKKKADSGLEQIAMGGRLWRTSASYWDFAWGRSVSLRQEDEKRKQDNARRALARARELARAKADPNDEVRTWTRVLEKLDAEAAAAAAEAAHRTNEMRSRIAQEQGRILDFVRRGKLFARAIGPPGVPIYPSATDDEMGLHYQMGRIPESLSRPAPLSSVSQFCGSYRSFGAGVRLVPASGAGALASQPGPAAGPAPATATANPLLNRLP